MPKKAGKNGTTPPSEPSVEYVQVKGDLLWKYRALAAEYDKIQMDLTRTKEQIEAFVAKTPELKELFGRRTDLMNQTSVAMKDLSDVREEIEKALGVNLKDCSIDDKTGILYVFKDGKEVPMSPPEVPAPKKKTSKRRAGAAVQV